MGVSDSQFEFGEFSVTSPTTMMQKTKTTNNNPIPYISLKNQLPNPLETPPLQGQALFKGVWGADFFSSPDGKNMAEADHLSNEKRATLVVEGILLGDDMIYNSYPVMWVDHFIKPVMWVDPYSS